MAVFTGDVILAAQQRSDRPAAGTITPAEWLAMLNASLQELYGILTSTYQDYNCKSYAFTLVGGSQANNSLVVGSGSAVPDFFQPRAMWLQLGNAPSPYATIPRLESLNERNLFTFPNIVPVYGAIPSRWNLLGSTIEILPPNVGGASYVLWYVPTLPTFSTATSGAGTGDQIDAYWLTINGWQEFAVVDVAIKALIKEESLETAQLLMVQKRDLKTRILQEAAPRDVSQPQAIVDMARVRNPWNGWGGGGMPGPNWGGDGSGCW
jgi:hypothetical protein